MREFMIKVISEPTTDDFWVEATENMTVESSDVRGAIIEALEVMEDDHFIKVSKTARKNAEPMYTDTDDGVAQVGYVVKGSLMVDFGDGSSIEDYRKKFVNLWVSIKEISPKLQLSEKINLN